VQKWTEDLTRSLSIIVVTSGVERLDPAII